MQKDMLPKSIMAQQEKLLSQIDKNSIDLSHAGDFGAYRALLENHPDGKKLLESHGLTPEYAELYIKEVSKYLEQKRFAEILDLGCGIGSTTYYLKKTFNSDFTLGVDLARDAISVAKSWYKDCEFHTMAVEVDTPFEQKFDLIHAREFYPFTRIPEQEYHLDFLKNLLFYLKDSGKIVIMSCTDKERFSQSIFAHIDHIQQNLPDYKFNIKKFNRLKCVKKLGPLASLMTYILDFFRVGKGSIMIISKQ